MMPPAVGEIVKAHATTRFDREFCSKLHTYEIAHGPTIENIHAFRNPKIQQTLYIRQFLF
jgi:hypothetical protein